LLVFVSQFIFGQNKYQYEIDLNKLENDQLKVKLIAPKIQTDEVVFYLPKIVPGTYSIYDFGRFMSDFSAFDEQGNKLKTSAIDVNSIKILDATKLYRIEYKIDDSFDDIGDNFIFQPAGVNFDANKNYQLNTFGLFGYFENKLNLPIELIIAHPEGFYGSTAMESFDLDEKVKNMDGFKAANYYDFADLPIMYCKDDTATLSIGGAEVLFSVYSEDNGKYAKELSLRLSKIVLAAESYLFGKLPMKKYAFLIYLFDPNAERTGGLYASGALEHTSSSVYFMPILPKVEFGNFMADVASHEFLHIITPLNIHSEEIGYFDFQNPKMSKHLWLYEGATEYNAKYIQLRSDMVTMKEYVEEIDSKIKNSKTKHNDTLPFTTLSLTCLENQDEYLNVYEKGALINLCLDIELKELSGGKYGLQELIRDLSLKYGKDKPFKDDELFDVIVSLTYPEIRDFFDKYVSGNNPLPLKEDLAKIGLNYEEDGQVKAYTFGFNKLGFDLKLGKFKIESEADLNEFGIMLGYKKNDILKSINGVEISYRNYQVFKELFLSKIVEDKPISVVVLRSKKEGKAPKKKTLIAPAKKVKTTIPYQLTEFEKLSPEQIKLRKQWLDKE
jgi:predicted metalloprotease with PDZ domain